MYVQSCMYSITNINLSNLSLERHTDILDNNTVSVLLYCIIKHTFRKHIYCVTTIKHKTTQITLLNIIIYKYTYVYVIT